MDFLFTNHISSVYPTMDDFKGALSHLDVCVITNDLILDSKPVPYFVVTFRTECDTYTKWVDMFEKNELIIVAGEYWAYKAL